MTTTDLGRVGVRFPVELARRGDRGELAIDLVDQGADRERTQAERSRALDDPRVVEIAASEAQAGRRRARPWSADGRADRAVTCDGDSPRSKSKPALSETKRATELVAQIREDRPELSLIDQKPSALLALGSRGGWGRSDFHGLLVPALVLELRAVRPAIGCRSASRVADVVDADLRDHDLIGQKRMAVGQIEHRLMRQLLRVIGARASLKDDLLIRVNNMKVTNPTVGDAVDVTLDELGEFQMVLAESEPPKLCSRVVHRHASLPLDRLHDWATLMRTWRAEPTDWEAVSRPRVRETWERTSTHRSVCI